MRRVGRSLGDILSLLKQWCHIFSVSSQLVMMPRSMGCVILRVSLLAERISFPRTMLVLFWLLYLPTREGNFWG